jgi:hypothetical protein
VRKAFHVAAPTVVYKTNFFRSILPKPAGMEIMCLMTGMNLEINMVFSPCFLKKAFAEFTNPEDKGTKYLKLADELWIYFPDAEEPVKISGHMLRESMMGSDFSYEDALENEELIKKYSVNVIGSEVINKSDCYILELNAKDKKVTYAKRKIWVDKEKFVVMKTQLFALSGKLLKEATMEDIRKYGDRYFATKLTMMNKLLKNSATIFEMTEIYFNAKIRDGIFSKRSLER